MSTRFLVLLVCAVLVYSANLWGTSVYILDEAKNAGCAMEMYERGDWVVPTFNGALRSDKPPLHYYFMRIAYEVFGVNPFAARLFSSVMGVLMVLLVFWFAKKVLGESAAFYSSLILISSLQLAVQFHLAVPDPYLIFFLTGGWLSFAYAYLKNKPRYYYFFYTSIALATLAKGPVAIVFSGLLVLIFLIAQRKFSWRSFLEIKIFQGAFLFLLIVLPWYVAVGIQTQGEWLEQFFFKHNVGRFTSSMEGHGGFPLASVVIVTGALIPFSFYIPQAARMIWKDQKQNPFLQFCMIALLLVVAFFAFSRTILPNYPEPSLPFLAILLGYFFSQAECFPEIKRLRLIVNATVYLIVALAIPFGAWSALQNESALKGLSALSIYFILFPMGAVAALFYVWRNDVRTACYVYALTSMMFLLIFFYILYPQIDRQNPVVQSVPLMHEPSWPVVSYRDFNPAYVFAFQRPVKKLETPEELAAFMRSTKHFYLVSQKKYWKDLPAGELNLLYEGKDLFERPVTIVLERR